MRRNASTRLEDDVIERLERVAQADCSNTSILIRKCVLRYLPILERDVLGEKFAITKPEPEPELEEVANG